ncbi:MAG: sugar ABC transporter permease [Brachyspira sp.]|nr:sugar ABC transporter permease [Brachyspira sp.]
MKKYSNRFGFYLSIPVIVSLVLFNFWPFITLLASVIHRGIKKLKSFFEASYFIPVLVDAVAYSMIFLLIFQDRGIANFVLSKLGIENIAWLKQSIPAKVLIIIVVSWRWTGYNMVLFLAAIQNIPEDYYEAATIDRANSFQKFIYITLPSLKPVILFTSIMSTIGTLNLFTEPFLLTNGGPNNGTMTLGLYIYNQAFVSLNMPYASTVSVVILIIVGTLTYLQLKIGERDN